MASKQSNGTVIGASRKVPKADEHATEPSSDKCRLPTWLTANKFESILRKNFPGYQKILHFKAYPALSAGENFTTVIVRVEIEMEVEAAATTSVSYILKVPMDTVTMKELMDKFDVFDTERSMYTDVIPEMEQMYKEAGLEVKFGAKCFILSADIDCIMLEDLRPHGFRNVNRLEGLDMEHTKSVLRKLAQWHAASATRVEIKGQYPGRYNNAYFKESNREFIKSMFASFADPFIKCIETYEGHEVYAESVMKLNANLLDEILKMGNINENEFNVLNHGDCWCNNVMFRYDEFGKIKETYLVDYQGPRFGSPAQDLYYFLLSSTQYEVKLKHFDFFIKFYHDNLVECLRLLKYPKKIPALKDIHIMLYKYGVWGYNAATGILPAVLLDPNDNANLANILSSDAARNELKILMYSNPRYRKHIEVVLPWLYNRGALEC